MMNESSLDPGAAKKFASDVERAAGNVAGAVKDAAGDVAASSSELLRKAKDTAQTWKSSVEAGVSEGRAKVQDAATSAVNHAGSWEHDLAGMIRRYPLPAIAIGLGVGFLVGQGIAHRTSQNGQ